MRRKTPSTRLNQFLADAPVVEPAQATLPTESAPTRQKRSGSCKT